MLLCNEKGHYKSECPERNAWEKLKKNYNKSGVVAMAIRYNPDEGLAAF